MRFPKKVLSIGVAVLALATLTLSLPRAAHAVAAALVQVTNTASNPVVTQTIGQQAGQSIQLYCDDFLGFCFQFPQMGNGLVTAYIPPAGQFLVITAVDVIPTNASDFSTCPVAHEVSVFAKSGSGSIPQDLQYIVPSNSGNLHASYPSGVVFPPGVPIILSTVTPVGCADTIRMYGYLTSN